MTSPSQRCSELRTRSSVAAASSSLFGAKTEGEEPAPEVGQHHALARRGEENLLDHVAHVVVAERQRGATVGRDGERIVE